MQVELYQVLALDNSAADCDVFYATHESALGSPDDWETVCRILRKQMWRTNETMRLRASDDSVFLDLVSNMVEVAFLHALLESDWNNLATALNTDALWYALNINLNPHNRAALIEHAIVRAPDFSAAWDIAMRSERHLYQRASLRKNDEVPPQIDAVIRGLRQKCLLFPRQCIHHLAGDDIRDPNRTLVTADNNARLFVVRRMTEAMMLSERWMRRMYATVPQAEIRDAWWGAVAEYTAIGKAMSYWAKHHNGRWPAPTSSVSIPSMKELVDTTPVGQEALQDYARMHPSWDWTYFAPFVTSFSPHSSMSRVPDEPRVAFAFLPASLSSPERSYQILNGQGGWNALRPVLRELGYASVDYIADALSHALSLYDNARYKDEAKSALAQFHMGLTDIVSSLDMQSMTTRLVRLVMRVCTIYPAASVDRILIAPLFWGDAGDVGTTESETAEAWGWLLQLLRQHKESTDSLTDWRVIASHITKGFALNAAIIKQFRRQLGEDACDGCNLGEWLDKAQEVSWCVWPWCGARSLNALERLLRFRQTLIDNIIARDRFSHYMKDEYLPDVLTAIAQERQRFARLRLDGGRQE